MPYQERNEKEPYVYNDSGSVTVLGYPPCFCDHQRCAKIASNETKKAECPTGSPEICARPLRQSQYKIKKSTTPLQNIFHFPIEKCNVSYEEMLVGWKMVDLLQGSCRGLRAISSGEKLHPKVFSVLCWLREINALLQLAKTYYFLANVL